MWRFPLGAPLFTFTSGWIMNLNKCNVLILCHCQYLNTWIIKLYLEMYYTVEPEHSDTWLSYGIPQQIIVPKYFFNTLIPKPVTSATRRWYSKILVNCPRQQRPVLLSGHFFFYCRRGDKRGTTVIGILYCSYQMRNINESTGRLPQCVFHLLQCVFQM